MQKQKYPTREQWTLLSIHGTVQPPEYAKGSALSVMAVMYITIHFYSLSLLVVIATGRDCTMASQMKTLYYPDYLVRTCSTGLYHLPT